ncbi:MAG TPA: PIG-L deacetylase family protein [Acidimicrobiales bacterium]|nr:PIG-L deacetylase family protein [Acidimicrobiales bacterium]
MLSDEEVERVLVITAHPDDVDFGAAGTVGTWTDRGIDVSYCVITDGDAGGFDPDVPRADIPSIRRAEQEAAAKAVGVEAVHFLGYPDGRLVVSIDLRRDLSRVIRRTRPDRVIIQSPLRNLDRVYASHPDHLAAGEAAMCAVYPDARNDFAFPELIDEGLPGHVVPEVWIMHGPDAATYVDITDAFDRKIDALLCHVSQHPDPEGLEGRMRAWGEALAKAGGLPDGRLAEVFRVVETR